MQVSTPMGDALGKYLDLTADQMKLTAGNMANVDTPGYKTQGFDFEAEFGRALAEPTHPTPTNTGRSLGTPARDGTAMNGAPRVDEVDGLVARPDGNTVSLDRESLQLAKSQLQFRTGVALLKSEYARMMSAIHAEAK